MTPPSIKRSPRRLVPGAQALTIRPWWNPIAAFASPQESVSVPVRPPRWMNWSVSATETSWMLPERLIPLLPAHQRDQALQRLELPVGDAVDPRGDGRCSLGRTVRGVQLVGRDVEFHQAFPLVRVLRTLDGALLAVRPDVGEPRLELAGSLGTRLELLGERGGPIEGGPQLVERGRGVFWQLLASGHAGCQAAGLAVSLLLTPSSSSLRKGFFTYAAAPACIPRSVSSSVPSVVMITTGIRANSGWAFTALRNSSPFILGMLMSRRISSMSLCSARRSRASRPSNACTSGKPRSIISNIRCSSLESSTTRTFFGFIASSILWPPRGRVKNRTGVLPPTGTQEFQGLASTPRACACCPACGPRPVRARGSRALRRSRRACRGPPRAAGRRLGNPAFAAPARSAPPR